MYLYFIKISNYKIIKYKKEKENYNVSSPSYKHEKLHCHELMTLSNILKMK